MPPLFIASLAATSVLSLWLPAAQVLLGAAGALYAALVTGCSAWLWRKHGLRCAAMLAAVFPVLHLSYGFGYLRGLAAALGPMGRRPGAAAVPLSR